MHFNPYKLLGINPVFLISKADLDRAYYALQRATHPDKSSPTSRMEAEISSAELNRAYQLLKNPVERAKALASLFGHKVEVQNNSQDILLEAMRWREAVSTLTPPSSNVESLKSELESDIQECLDQIDFAFDQNDYESLNPLVTRLSFLQKVKEDIKGKGF